MITDIVNCFKDQFLAQGVELIDVTLDSKGFDRMLEEVRSVADLVPEPITLRIVSFKVLGILFKRNN